MFEPPRGPPAGAAPAGGRMCVLALTGLNPWVPSGPGLVLAGLLTHLAAQGFGGTVFLGPRPGATGKLAGSYRLRIWITSPSRGRRALAYARFWIAAVQAAVQSDLVLFNSPPVGLALVPLLASKLARRPSVWIVHGGAFIEPANTGRLAQGAVRWASRQVTALIAVSQGMADIVHEATGRAPVVILNAFAAPQLRDTPAARPDPVFVYVGRLEPIKRVDLLIQAFRTLLAERPGCRLRLMGSGSLEPALRTLVQKEGLAPQIEFCGFQTGAAKAAILDAADVLVLPSDFEPFGMVILEAWAHGLAVVGSRGGGISEIVRAGETGLLFAPGDGAQLSACLQQICDPPLRTTLARAGQRELMSRFTWERAGGEYAQLFAALTGRRYRKERVHA
ncbi:MAG TPA: glycosyltransferase family 4 protein [Chloroflexia bacterium]|nr:glycosyltransferase family 4 protein [Chloroflexia bacterium]